MTLNTKMKMASISAPDQFETNTTAVYEITGAQNYPKKAGNETTVMETDITVPAGTFTCFKEVEYDEAGAIVYTRWQAADTKHFNVKTIDSETGEVMELTSYDLTL